jgi:hypothetical protein
MENRSWATMFMLLRYTGQRTSDCAKMQWADNNEARQAIYVTQQKTGKKMWVPCHRRLREWLAATPRTSDFIVMSRNGEKFDSTSVSSTVSKVAKQLGFAGYSAHGLRPPGKRSNRCRMAAARRWLAGVAPAADCSALVVHRAPPGLIFTTENGGGGEARKAPRGNENDDAPVALGRAPGHGTRSGLGMSFER